MFAEEFSETFSGPVGFLAGMWMKTQTGIPGIQFHDKEDRWFSKTGSFTILLPVVADSLRRFLLNSLATKSLDYIFAKEACQKN